MLGLRLSSRKLNKQKLYSTRNMAAHEQSFPVFGLSDQRSWLYQPEINLMTTEITEITQRVVDIESEIAAIIANLTAIETDVAILETTAVVNFNAQSTYDSIACPGSLVVDTFEAPVVSGQSIVYSSRPLYSSDGTVVVTHDATCGYIDLSLASPGSGATLATAAGPVSLVYGSGLGPDLEMKGLSAGSSAVALSSPGLGSTVVIATTGSNVHLYDAIGATVPIVSTDTGPILETKSLVAGSGISLSAPGDTVTVAATGTNVTLTSSVSGTSLVSAGTGPGLSVCSLVAARNVSISGTGVVAMTQTSKSYGTFRNSAPFVLVHAATNVTYTIPSAFTPGGTVADFQVFNTDGIQYTGATTKIFKMTASLSFNVVAPVANYIIFMTISINNATAIPPRALSSSRTVWGYNSMSVSVPISLAQNDYVYMKSISQTGVGNPYPISINCNNIVVTFEEI